MSEGPPQQSPYSRLLDHAFSQAIPLNCQIEITYRCNHLCTFCYNSPSGAREMTTPQIFDRAAQGVGDGCAVHHAHRRRGALPQGLLQDRGARCKPARHGAAHLLERLPDVGQAGRAQDQGSQPVRGRDLDPRRASAKPTRRSRNIKGSFAKTVQAIREPERGRDQGRAQVPDHPAEPGRAVRHQGSRRAAWAVRRHLRRRDHSEGRRQTRTRCPCAPDDDFLLQRYWGEWYTKLHDGKLPPTAQPLRVGRLRELRDRASPASRSIPTAACCPVSPSAAAIGNVLEMEDLAQASGPGLSRPERGAGARRRGQATSGRTSHEDGD